MNEKYERKTLKLKQMSHQEFLNKNPITSPVARKRKENKKLFKNILKRYAYIFTGIGTGKSTISNSSITSTSNFTPSAKEWRQSQSMEDYIRERIQKDGYLDLVDGRGDPPEHNCDHDER